MSHAFQLSNASVVISARATGINHSPIHIDGNQQPTATTTTTSSPSLSSSSSDHSSSPNTIAVSAPSSNGAVDLSTGETVEILGASATIESVEHQKHQSEPQRQHPRSEQQQQQQQQSKAPPLPVDQQQPTSTSIQLQLEEEELDLDDITDMNIAADSSTVKSNMLWQPEQLAYIVRSFWTVTGDIMHLCHRHMIKHLGISEYTYSTCAKAAKVRKDVPSLEEYFTVDRRGGGRNKFEDAKPEVVEVLKKWLENRVCLIQS
jgi:hypothetical protein